MKNFPARYEGLPEPVGDRWLQAAKKAYGLLESGGIVILFGDRGPGKTRMAYELAHEPDYPLPWVNPEDKYSSLRRPAIYRTAMGIFLEIRNTFRKDSPESELDVMEALSGAVLLVIDEIQERGESRFEDQKLTSIIDARYREGRPTLLIGNFKNAQELVAGISPSVLSRIQEGGGAIHCDWPSFRAAKPATNSRQ
jgi:DNA replication protein DnaC